MPGVSTANLTVSNYIDDLVGNYGSNTRRITISRLAAIIAALMGPTHATRAALYADLAWPVGAVGYVRGDGTPAYNGVYRKSGASGSGSWTRIGDLPTSAVEAGLIDDLRSEMRAAGNAGDILRLTGYGGTADAVTGDLRVDQAHITVAIGQLLAVVWPGANTATDPTLTFGGLTFVVRRRTGVLGPGDLQSARYLGVVASMPAGASPGVIRIMEAVSAADITGLYPALRDGATLPTTVSGTGDAVVLTISADLQAVGVSEIGTASELEYLCTAANTVANPAIAVIGSGTQNFTVRDADGNAWPAGGFVSGRTYKLRRRGTVLRVVGGDITRADLAGDIGVLGRYTLYSVSGTNAVTAITDGSLSNAFVLRDGAEVLLTPADAASGAITLAINGGPAMPVREMNAAAIPDGSWRAGRSYLLRYLASGSAPGWRIIAGGNTLAELAGRASETALAAVQNLGALYMLQGISTGADITASTHGDLAGSFALRGGMTVIVQAQSAATAPITLAINGGSAIPVLDMTGLALPSAGWRAGRVYLLRLFGSALANWSWRIVAGGWSLGDLAGLATNAALTSAVNTLQGADAALQAQIDGLSSGVTVVGAWDASSSAFPVTRPGGALIQAGDTWIVSGAGTIDGAAFGTGDQLVALAPGGGATVDGNWLHIPGGGASGGAGAHVTPGQFGVVGDGVTDDTEALRTMHAYANANRRPVSYAGIERFAVRSDAQIAVNSDVDWAGAEIVVLGGLYPSPSWSTPHVIFLVVDPDAPLETGFAAYSGAPNGSFTPLAGVFDGPGYCYLQRAPASPGPSVAERDGLSLLPYRQSFRAVKNGRVIQPLSVGMEAVTEVYYRRRRMSPRGWIRLRGLVIDPTGINNECILRVNRNQVAVKHLSIHADPGASLPESVNQLIWIEDCCDIRMEGCTGVSMASSGSVGTYALYITNVAEITVSGCAFAEGWGWMASHRVNGLYLSDCRVDRIDAHAGGHNIFVDRCTLMGRGVVYGWGGGTIRVTNSTVFDAAAISSRMDYGGYFWGDLIADGVTIAGQTADLAVVDLATYPIGVDAMDAPAPRLISVSDVRRTGRAGQSRVRPVALAVNPAVAGHVAAPASVVVDGISADGSWDMVMRIEMENMIAADRPSIKIRHCHPTSAGELAAGQATLCIPAGTRAGAGGYDYDVRIDDCSQVAVDTRASSGAAHDLDGVGLRALLTADGTDTRITGGSLTDPILLAPATVSPLGGAIAGGRYMTIIGAHVTGAWDLSASAILAGVMIPPVAANADVVLPAGVTPAQALTGWITGDLI